MDRSPFHISIFHLYRGKSLRKETIQNYLIPFANLKLLLTNRINIINLLSPVALRVINKKMKFEQSRESLREEKLFVQNYLIPFANLKLLLTD